MHDAKWSKKLSSSQNAMSILDHTSTSAVLTHHSLQGFTLLFVTKHIVSFFDSEKKRLKHVLKVVLSWETCRRNNTAKRMNRRKQTVEAALMCPPHPPTHNSGCDLMIHLLNMLGLTFPNLLVTDQELGCQYSAPVSMYSHVQPSEYWLCSIITQPHAENTKLVCSCITLLEKVWRPLCASSCATPPKICSN